MIINALSFVLSSSVKLMLLKIRSLNTTTEVKATTANSKMSFNNVVLKPSDSIISSLSAKSIYLKRGYKEVEYHTISTKNDDYLCYDVMKKTL